MSERDGTMNETMDDTKFSETVQPVPETVTTQWQRVRSRLRAELGEATFNSWFKALNVRTARKGVIVLHVPTRFVGSWIEANYLNRIRDHWPA